MAHVGYRSGTSFARGLASLLLLLVCAGLGSCSSLTHVTFRLVTDETTNEGRNFDVHVFQLRDRTTFDSKAWTDLKQVPIERFGSPEALGLSFIENSALTYGLDSRGGSNPVTVELKDGAKYIGIFGRFRRGDETPMAAFTLHELVDAKVEIIRFTIRLAGEAKKEEKPPEAPKDDSPDQDRQ